MSKNHFEFWYNGHQVLAVRNHDNIYHFYVGLVEPARIRNPIFDDYLARYFENDSTITITSQFDETSANRELYSAYALSFFSTKDAGIEAAFHLCRAISQLDYSERDYQEFKFMV